MPAKAKNKRPVKFKYEYEYVSYHELAASDADTDETHKEAHSIFTCAPSGVCRKDTSHTAIDGLTQYLNIRGEGGWELVQLFPQEKGILYLFKQSV